MLIGPNHLLWQACLTQHHVNMIFSQVFATIPFCTALAIQIDPDWPFGVIWCGRSRLVGQGRVNWMLIAPHGVLWPASLRVTHNILGHDSATTLVCTALAIQIDTYELDAFIPCHKSRRTGSIMVICMLTGPNRLLWQPCLTQHIQPRLCNNTCLHSSCYSI